MFGAMATMPGRLMAQDGRLDVADSGDTAWMLAAAALVSLALPGLALFHAGCARSNSRLSILAQSAAVFAVATLLWTMVGYTLAFGDISGGWIGAGNAWMLMELGNVRGGTTTPESAFALFQIGVAALPLVLMVGAWAERARFGWVVTFCALWTLVVQAPIAHWAWGGGWMSRQLGLLDWAGGLPLFTSAGVSALVVVSMMGPRLALPCPERRPSSPAAMLSGGGLAWLGALGLCGGWAVAANDDAAAAMISAHVAIAAAAVTWAGIERLTAGRVTLGGLACGILAGIATIAPAAGYVSPGAAILFGILGALTGYQARRLMLRYRRIDDVSNVFAVPGICGAVGSLMLSVFLARDFGGVGYYDGMSLRSQAFAQGIGIAVVVAWSAMVTTIIASMASLVFPMRVSEDAERAGLDSTIHHPSDD
jgi:Amt family ammonium transporter